EFIRRKIKFSTLFGLGPTLEGNFPSTDFNIRPNLVGSGFNNNMIYDAINVLSSGKSHQIFIMGDCIREQHYDNAIVFSATLTCHAGGIGQPETYKGEAIDEASYQDRYIGRRKRTFTLDYLEPGDIQARQAAERILAGLRKIRTYYDCGVRGMPHLRLMDTVALTEPKADLSARKLQVIKLVDSMEVANYMGEVGLMERKIPSATPTYWETAEHDFIINTQ
ncbi:unnamed protein product, partial [marine sediment metagenome]